MNSAELLQVCDEISAALVGRSFGRIFASSRDSFVVDFHPHVGQYLLVQVSGRDRRVHLIRQRLKSLERSATNPSPFLLKLKDALSNRELTSAVACGAGIRLTFETRASIVIDIAKVSRNVLLVSADDVIEGALFQSDETVFRIGEKFDASPVQTLTPYTSVKVEPEESMSDAFDRTAREREEIDEFEKLAAAAKRKATTEIAKRRKLLDNLHADIARHGDAEKWKRLGDLLLANIGTAKRVGDSVIVTDYFADDAPEMEIEGDANIEIAEIAAEYFRRYTKARNAATVVKERIKSIELELESQTAKLKKIEGAIEHRDVDFLSGVVGHKKAQPAVKPKKAEAEIKGVRRFVSSDGFEILVGKKATDNDYLSFRIAKSNDLWMHAADYPGSHVVIRNPNKNDIPHRTLIEAAELAAFYSSGKKQVKAAVNYTLKKHINKPRRAAPGLVSLSSFKTILVEPKATLKIDI